MSRQAKFSKRWQEQQPIILHLALAGLWGCTLFWLQTELDSWQKGLLIAGSLALVATLARRFHRRHADRLVKVFEVEQAVASRIVQRALNSQALPFHKRTSVNRVRFDLWRHKLALIVESFPLNLPVDDHIAPVRATKVTLRHLSRENMPFGEDLCTAIDEAFVASGAHCRPSSPSGRNAVTT